MNSNKEIELKFFVNSDLSADAVVALVDQNLSDYDLQKFPRRNLKNTYYDTENQLLKNHGVGLRVRRDGESYEETVKSDSETEGGLHCRTEYNVQIKSENPDLKLFPEDFWKERDLDPESLQSSLRGVFSTDFCRIRRKIIREGRVIAEFSFDFGKITVGDKFELINEIELEVVDGSLKELLEIARKVVENDALKLNLDSRSKAQRGYELAGLSVPPSAKSFLLLDGARDALIREYFKMYMEHEQLLLSRFDLRSLSVMTLSAYQLQKLTNDHNYNMIIPVLLELERMVADSQGRREKFMKMICSRLYLLFVLNSYEAIYCS